MTMFYSAVSLPNHNYGSVRFMMFINSNCQLFSIRLSVS